MIPQYQNRQVSQSVLVCDSCLLKLQTYRDLSEYACTDVCSSCGNDYLVDPIELDRRINEEGRGKHICDDCLTVEGFGGYNYIQKHTCSSCNTDSPYMISLKPEEPTVYICDNCKTDELDIDNHEEAEWDGELGDEQMSKTAHASVEKARKTPQNVAEKYREGAGPFVYQMVTSDTKSDIGPANIWAKIYELEPDDYLGRLMTFDLVEISPEELTENILPVIDQPKKYNKIIKPNWITWNLLWYDHYRETETTHSEFFQVCPEGFDSLYRAADQLSIYVIDKLKQGELIPGINNGRLQNFKNTER